MIHCKQYQNMHERAIKVVGAFHLIGLTCRSNVKNNRC